MDGVGGRKLTIALAGNANVGKSVIFNELTGLHQHVGNWPGKTVERAEGTLSFRGYTIDVLDLPGSDHRALLARVALPGDGVRR